MAEYEPMSDAAYTYETSSTPQLAITTRSEKLHYWFDNFFASDPMAKPYTLAALNIAFMTVFAVILHVAGSQGGDWSENFWMGFTFAADFAETDHGGPFPYWHLWILRMINFTFSFGGGFIFGMVIVLVSGAVSSRVGGLKLGSAKVLEQDHTLILGFNDRVLALLVQICLANESEGGRPIVLLSERSKSDMDDLLDDALEHGDRRGSKIVCRSGSRIEAYALTKCAVTYARSVIILSQGDDPDAADVEVIRTTLALTAGLPRKLRPRCHFTIELQDFDNTDVALLGVFDQTVAADTVIPVVCHDIIGRIMVQSAREVGLSNCFENLLCFDGSECYFGEWPTLTGMTFREACFCFEDAVVLGIRFTDDFCRAEALARPVQLNPTGDYVIRDGDKILVLAEDNDTYEAGNSHETPRTPVPPFEMPPQPPENILLAGWRRDFDDMIVELDKWVPRGSRLTLLSQIEDPEEELEPVAYMKSLLAAGGLPQLFNITQMDFLHGDPTNIRVLEQLGAKTGGLPIDQYNSTILLCRENAGLNTGGMNADSRVMVTMLVMRHLQHLKGVENAVLVAEIKDCRTDALMSLTKCSDAVVGNELCAMIIAQISEDHNNAFVFEDLFSSEGMEMHVKDVRMFVAPTEVLSFWDLVGRCQLRDMIPIGWVRKSKPGWAKMAKMEQYELNPANKDEKIRFEDGDQMIVISED